MDDYEYNSLWCGVAQIWCGVAQIWCGVAQLVAGRQAVFDFRLGTTGRCFPTEHTSDEEMERGLSEWQRINVLNECD
jgi:hypothetical protein